MLFVRDNTPNAETTYQTRFYIDPNGIQLNGGNHAVFRGLSSTGTPILRANLGYNPDANEYQIQIMARLEDGDWLLSPGFTLAGGANAIEIGWGVASAPGVADGWLRLWLDGVLVYEHTQVTNAGLALDAVELGAVGSPLTGTAGMYCVV